jgi:hypothetical protein
VQGAKVQGGSSDLGNQEKEWKSIWAIRTPEKMKIVLWRMAHDCLQIGFQVQHRQIPANEGLVFYGRSKWAEHLLLFCPSAESVWDSVKEIFSVKLMKCSFSYKRRWIFDFIARLSPVQTIALVVACWQI